MAVPRKARAETKMREDLARLVSLVEESRVEDARGLAPELAARWPDSREIQNMARVLEPPKIIPTRPGPPGRSLARDREWVREHGHEYPGSWLATLEDRLIAADPSVERVMEIVKSSVDLTREMPLVHYPYSTAPLCRVQPVTRPANLPRLHGSAPPAHHENA